MSTSETVRQRRRGSRWLRGLLWAVLVLAVAVGGWARWLYGQIEWYATRDLSAPSDAIAVFGAAEYAGKPSPLFRSRLDHAKSLFDRGIAPLIVTLGGDGGDLFSEGAVGRAYLMGTGVPESALIAETMSTSTSQSVKRLVVIARANNLQRITVVSDGTHLFRIHEICEANGLNVRTSPRPRVEVEDPPPGRDAILHEMLTYTLWRLHLD